MSTPTPLATLRRRRLLTLRALAALAGVTPVTVMRIEHDTVVPTFKTMAKIAAALGVEPDQIAEFARVMEGGLLEAAAA